MCLKALTVLVVLMAVAGPMIVSEVMGGWTRKYTTRGFGLHEMPSLEGKVAIVTGANTGIGKESARELARRGAEVIVAARSRAKGEAAAADIRASVAEDVARAGLGAPRVRFMALDLASLTSVRQFAAEFRAGGSPLHILLLNAGVMKSPGTAFVGRTFDYGACASAPPRVPLCRPPPAPRVCGVPRVRGVAERCLGRAGGRGGDDPAGRQRAGASRGCGRGWPLTPSLRRGVYSDAGQSEGRRGGGGLLLACLLLCLGDALTLTQSVPGMRTHTSMMCYGLAQSERALCMCASVGSPLYFDFVQTLAKGSFWFVISLDLPRVALISFWLCMQLLAQFSRAQSPCVTARSR